MNATGTPLGTDDLIAQLQTTVGKSFEILRELSSSPGGRLLLARHRESGREAAIRVLTAGASSAESAESFRRAMAAAARLQHRNVPPILEAAAGSGLAWYVMPWTGGETLRARLAREFRLSVIEASRIIGELCDATHHAHQLGILHGDINTEHVVITGDHTLLSGFGVPSSAATPDADTPARASGYTAPEQLRAPNAANARSDVYSLGIVAYEVLAGERPYASDAHALATGPLVAEPPKLAAVRRDISHRVSEVVARAMARDPARRYRSPAAFRTALLRAAAPPEVRMRRAIMAGGLGAAFLLVIIVALMVSRRHGITDNVVAVAPFEVTDARHAFWGEGLADLLSASLDGSGPVRTIPANVAVKAWQGQGDNRTAARFARSLGARLALSGRLVPGGNDSLRVTASIIDAISGKSLEFIEFSEHVGRMDRLADTLVVHVLRTIGQSEAIGSVRRAPLGTRSLPALRAFLQGEQAYRRGEWDSARSSYLEAVARDSTFATAYSRLNRLLSLNSRLDQSAAASYVERAVRFSGDLAPRESILILRDSLVMALRLDAASTSWRPAARRLQSLVDSLENGRAGSDPDLWLLVAEERMGALRYLGADLEKSLYAAERAASLDTSLAPAYGTAFKIAWRLGGWTMASTYLRNYVRASAGSQTAQALDALIIARDNPSAEGDELRRLVGERSASVLLEAAETASGVPDTTATSLRLARLRAGSSYQPPATGDSLRLARIFAIAGAEQEAFQFARGGTAPSYDLWLAREPRTDAARSAVRAWLVSSSSVDSEPSTITLALAAANDAALMKAVAAEARRREALLAPRRRGRAMSYLALAASAYEMLARGDSSGAAAQLLAIPDSLARPDAAAVERLLLLRTLNDMGRTADADETARRSDGTFTLVQEWGAAGARVLWAFERARSAQRRGDANGAVRDYTYVMQMWSRADPRLQWYVQESAAALRRLGVY